MVEAFSRHSRVTDSSLLLCSFSGATRGRKSDTVRTPSATQAIREIFRKNIELWQEPDTSSVEAALKDARLSGWRSFEVESRVNHIIRREQLAVPSKGVFLLRLPVIDF